MTDSLEDAVARYFQGSSEALERAAADPAAAPVRSQMAAAAGTRAP